VADAIDVDNVSDYKEMVKKITDEKPSIVKVFVDTRHINKLPRGSTTRGSRSSEDDSGATTDSVRVCAIFTSMWNVANICQVRVYSGKGSGQVRTETDEGREQRAGQEVSPAGVGDRVDSTTKDNER